MPQNWGSCTGRRPPPASHVPRVPGWTRRPLSPWQPPALSAARTRTSALALLLSSLPRIFVSVSLSSHLCPLCPTQPQTPATPLGPTPRDPQALLIRKCWGRCSTAGRLPSSHWALSPLPFRAPSSRSLSSSPPLRKRTGPWQYHCGLKSFCPVSESLFVVLCRISKPQTDSPAEAAEKRRLGRFSAARRGGAG